MEIDSKFLECYFLVLRVIVFLFGKNFNNIADMERKLSTIFASDVVGFSKMMEQNEENTLKLLQKRKVIIESEVIEHRGNVFGGAGDSIIAEFASPVKATECAVKVQEKMLNLNEKVHECEKMNFRIGINVGDVMVSEGNLYGDAVNIAARLESEAKPSGICISRQVFDLISQKIQVSFENAGELKLKNISQPIQAYFIVKQKGNQRYFKYDDVPQIKINNAEPGSLAVMLFKNLGKDEELSYFCEGFSEDLITSLSKFNKMVVVSGNASFNYQNNEKRPKIIGKELGVRYILDGTVRKLGGKMRIGAKLTSSERENNIWSHNFDLTEDEIFDVQDEIVETIVSTIVGRVEYNEVKELFSSRTENLTAYDLVLKGLEHHRKSNVTVENAKKAVEYFDKAIELDPNYARAHAWRACSMSNYHSWRPDKNRKKMLAECTTSVKKALELDPNDHEAHRIMGSISLNIGNFDLAQYHHERAKELCPSDAYILGKNAALLVFLGEPEQALETVHKAMRINPFCPDDLFIDEGMCHFWLKNFLEAIKCFKKIKTPCKESLFYLAASYAKLGKTKQSIEMLKQSVKVTNMSPEDFLMTQGYKEIGMKNELKCVIESIPK